MLLFTTPQRLPGMRLEPTSVADLAGHPPPVPAADGMVDGVQLIAKDPAEATRRLVAAGARQTRDSRRWLREHRRVVTAPAERATARRRRSWFRILCVTSQVLFWAIYAPALVVAHAWDDLNVDLGSWLLPIEAFLPIAVVSAVPMFPADGRIHRSRRRV